MRPIKKSGSGIGIPLFNRIHPIVFISYHGCRANLDYSDRTVRPHRERGGGREVAVAGTCQTVVPRPQDFADAMLARTGGVDSPDSRVANAIDVALFVLFLGVMNAIGAILIPVVNVAGY